LEDEARHFFDLFDGWQEDQDVRQAVSALVEVLGDVLVSAGVPRR
jgi:hypothetical protein